MEPQKTQNYQSNPEEKNKAGGITLRTSNNATSYSNQNSVVRTTTTEARALRAHALQQE